MNIEEMIARIEKREKCLKDFDDKIFLSKDAKSPTELKPFLDWFFNEYNPINGTYYESGNTQCTYGRRRSLSDTYRLVLNYIPDTKLIDVIYNLVELNDEGRINVLRCNDIGTLVYSTNTNIGITMGNEASHRKIHWYGSAISDPSYRKDSIGITGLEYAELYDHLKSLAIEAKGEILVEEKD